MNYLLIIFIAILSVYAYVFLQLDKAAGDTLCNTIRTYVNTYGIEAVRQGARERGYSEKLIKSLERRCLKDGR